MRHRFGDIAQEEEKVKKQCWREELYDFLVFYAQDMKVSPFEMMTFLMSFIGHLVKVEADEEDLRVVASSFYKIIQESIKMRTENDRNN